MVYVDKYVVPTVTSDTLVMHWPDPETEALEKICKELNKIKDLETRERILSYIVARYVPQG